MPAPPPAPPGASQQVPMSHVEAWYDEHVSCVLGLALRMMGDKAAAEAVVVEVFVVARHTGGRWPRGTCGPRLVQLTQQRAAAQLRERRSLRPVRRVARQRERAWPRSDLRASHGELIEASYFGGYTVDELIARFDLPPQVVCSRLRSSMVELARILEARGSEAAV